MSDNGNPVVKFSIELEPGGKLKVEAPGTGEVYDEPICFWLLEKAKDFIKVRNAQAMKANIYVPDRLRRKD